ncbi:brca2 and cdkn1a-interacting [Lynx pardinus]|uniref:Brca2 and cdkn1a-interacting n=1 Tax=Lynx pardinus TaxID=191816 RepID=A0A485NWC1_LYNPA|nr:brca2 and cdkn1a-interacting [Lynx pardinus]
MHQQLQKELAEAHGTNKLCGECSFYLLISKTFVEAGKNNPKKKWSSQEKDEFMFASAEEEIFYEKAILKFNYSVQEESDTCLGGRWSFDNVPMKPLQTVMLIPGDKMDEIMGKLKEHLSLSDPFPMGSRGLVFIFVKLPENSSDLLKNSSLYSD